jgi:hypothetical protein
MKKLVFAICAMTALAGAISPHAQAAGYSYKFIPTFTDLPPLSDWAAKLDLNAASSVGGGLSDIDQSDSWLKTPYGFFTLSQSSDVTSHVPLVWNAAGIESMDITGRITLGNIADYNWTITPTDIEIEQPDPSGPFASGTWAYVPDATATVLWTGLAAAGLCGFEFLSRNRQLTKARLENIGA